MFYVSEVKTKAPENFQSELQQKIYETLAHLDIPFERVDNDPAITMEAVSYTHLTLPTNREV